MQLKKIIAILVIFVCVGTVLSAQDFGISFGGGVLLDWNFGNGMKFTNGDNTISGGTRNMSFGGYAFLDVTYAEIDVSFSYGGLTQAVKAKGDYKEAEMKDYGFTNGGDGGSVLQLGFTLLGKYPVKMGQLTVFPLLGVGYNMVLSHSKTDYPIAEVKDGDKVVTPERKISELNQFSILGGGGLDYNINRNLYLRISALAQLRFASKALSDSVSAADDGISEAKKLYPDVDYPSVSTVLGFGPVIKVGVGYRF